MLPASKHRAAHTQDPLKSAARFEERNTSRRHPHAILARNKTTPAKKGGPHDPLLRKHARRFPVINMSNRNKHTTALSEQIQALVNGYDVTTLDSDGKAKKSSDKYSPKLTGLLDAVEKLVPKINARLAIDNTTLTISTELGILSHTLGNESKKALMKYQQKLCKGNDEKKKRLEAVSTSNIKSWSVNVS